MIHEVGIHIFKEYYGKLVNIHLYCFYMETESYTCAGCGYLLHTGEHSPKCPHVIGVHQEQTEIDPNTESIHLRELKKEQESERLNTQVALEVISRFEMACRQIDGFKDMDRNERAKHFSQALKKLWPENDGRSIAPEFQLGALNPSYAHIFLSIRPFTKNADMGPSSLKLGKIIVRIGIQQLLENGPGSLDTDLERIGLYIFHELEHILQKGGDELSGGEDKKQLFEYLSIPGEMRAYAKGFAFRYTRRFPGKKFQKAYNDTLLLPGKVDEAYYRLMTEGNKQEQEVSVAMYELTSWYVDLINELNKK